VDDRVRGGCQIVQEGGEEMGGRKTKRACKGMGVRQELGTREGCRSTPHILFLHHFEHYGSFIQFCNSSYIRFLLNSL